MILHNKVSTPQFCMSLQVDFAHTFPSGGQMDENFAAGARALLQALKAVVSMDAHDCLM